MSLSPSNPATPDELAALLPHVLSAPADSGPVRLLCVRTGPNVRSFPDRLTLSRAAGVEGDHASSTPWLKLPDDRPDPRIQVSVISWRVLDLVWRDRDRVVHPGDNIALDMNLTEANLPAGTLIRAGTAVLRVSDVPNSGCAKWKVRCGAATYDWTRTPGHAPLRLRGMYCSVERDGTVSLGDVAERL